MTTQAGEGDDRVKRPRVDQSAGASPRAAAGVVVQPPAAAAPNHAAPSSSSAAILGLAATRVAPPAALHSPAAPVALTTLTANGTQFKCADCGELFLSRGARVAHQMLSGAPYTAAWPPPTAAPSRLAELQAALEHAVAAEDYAKAAELQPQIKQLKAAIEAAAAAATATAEADSAVAAGAPKHGVRLLRSMLEVGLALPAIQAEPLVALDLEGDLTPSATCAVDLLQVYLPSVDAVLLVHVASLPREPLAALLRPWLESPRHLKVMCDPRADSHALQFLMGIRLQGVLDVQLCHAATTGELTRVVSLAAEMRRQYATPAKAAAADKQLVDRGLPYPTGLSRLAATYCPREVAAPVAELKGRFGALFDAGHSPFRTLPLSAAAASYASADVWHIWLVYEALWTTLEQGALAAPVLLASESRAGDFRDVPSGRERWDRLMALAKSHKADKRTKGANTAANTSANAAANAAANTAASAALAAAVSDGNAAVAEAASAPSPAVGVGAVVGVVGADGPSTRKKRQVSGPGCDVCGVCFSGTKQLDEHLQGKRHAIAAAIASAGVPRTLAIECRQAPLDLTAIRTSFQPYGTISRVTLEAQDPLGGAPLRAMECHRLPSMSFAGTLRRCATDCH